jgi:hypothetical protein
MGKQLFTNNNPKQRIFYTQEGTPYVIRRFTQVMPNIINATGMTVFLVAVFNPANSTSNWFTRSPFGAVAIQSNKPVVPIMFDWMVVGEMAGPPRTFPVIANLQLPWYCVQDQFDPSGGGGNYQNLKALAKMSPMIEMIESDPATITSIYGLKYGQAALQDDDFMEVQGSAAFIFTQSAANAYCNLPEPIAIPDNALNAYFPVITFSYFELQK